MDLGILGPLVVRRDGVPIDISAAKQRALLICLVIRLGQTVSVERLTDALWENNPPPQSRVTLRSYVSSLRRLLEMPDAPPVIVTHGNGYSLHVPAHAVDAVRFDDLMDGAHQAMRAEEHASALTLLDHALGLWRGEPLEDVADSAFAVGERSRLRELRLSAHEDRFDVLLALGRHREAVAALELFTADAPLRERAQGQLMVALYRSGRTADALASYNRHRQMLIDELGLDPSAELQQLAERILRQQPILPETPAVPSAPKPPATPAPAPDASNAPASHPPSGGSTRSALVGRQHERGELRTAVERLSTGAGGLLLIAGEPGIGKSTLLEDLARVANAAGMQVRWGRCQDTTGVPAFWPWIQVLRDTAARLDDGRLRTLAAGPAAPVAHLVDDIASRLGGRAPALRDDLESARFQLYDAIAAFLLGAATDQPMVVLIDDLHWADPPTLETLSFVAPLLESGRVLIAAAYRDISADWRHDLEATLATVVREPLTQQVGLVGLQPADVGDLAEQLTGERLAPEERDALHQRTGGNPFFVRQLSQLAAEAHGRLRSDLAIPTGVRHVIARRLNLLPDTVRRLLKSASVVGWQFDVRWLADATDTDVAEALDAAVVAVENGLIEPIRKSATSYRFVHALVRETIHEGLGPVEAARVHAQVAVALETTPNARPAALAEHFARAADILDDDRPLRYLLAAADDALGMYAHEQAESYLRQALQLLADRPSDPATELRVRVRLVQLLISTHGWSSPTIEEVAEPARHLARMAGSHPEIIPLWEALFVQYWTRGNVRVAKEMSDHLRAGADASGHPAAIAASLVAHSELELTLGGDYTTALTDAEEAERQLELYHGEDGGDVTPVLWLSAAHVKAFAHAFLGEREAAIAAARRAIMLAERYGRYPKALAYMAAGYVGMVACAPEFAADTSAEAIRLAEEQGFSHVATAAMVFESWAKARLGGNPSEHADRMLDGIRAMGRKGDVDGQAKRLLFAADTYLLAGDHNSALACLDDARRYAAINGEALSSSTISRIESEAAMLARNHP